MIIEERILEDIIQRYLERREHVDIHIDLLEQHSAFIVCEYRIGGNDTTDRELIPYPTLILFMYNNGILYHPD